jgi:hypothetical protein
MMQGHTISYFSTLQGDRINQVNVMGMVSYPQHKYDSNYKTYNRGLIDHPNLRYEN